MYVSGTVIAQSLWSGKHFVAKSALIAPYVVVKAQR